MAKWVISIISSTGSWGIALLMFLENVFPPIPSEVIMPLAGYMVTNGELSFISIVIAGTVGSVLGALPLYYAGRRMGEHRLNEWADRHGCWLTISRNDIESASRWFDRHGGVAVFFCRLLPGIRSLISIPAGIKQMNMASFLAFTAVGSAIWTAVLAFLGYWLGSSFQKVDEYLNPISWVIFGGLAILYIVRVIKQRRQGAAKQNA
ncbi:DedA family protein [Nibrella saemangeumensis]|uniref:DedA family protein n=1 Tax=Nibrella saemangeumensis TaxID=1084526 RepID=A0ABP8NSZ1_9BACT